MSTPDHIGGRKNTLDAPGANRIARAFCPLLAVEELGGHCYDVHNGAKDTSYGVDLLEGNCTCYDGTNSNTRCKHYLRALFESGLDPLHLE